MKKILLLLLVPALFAQLLFAQQKQIKKPDGKILSTATIDKIVKQLMDTAEVN
jgi:hypothetical protein